MKKYILAVLLFSSYALAQSSICNNGANYQNTLPKVQYNQEVCFKEYSVLYNYSYKIPMVSSEHLTAQEVAESETIGRKNSFHVESTIPVPYESKPKDYAHTGYDLGHMTPAGDMGNYSTEFETFSLSNMTPQNPKLNRVTWRKIENIVRTDAKKYNEVYVVTGSIVNDQSKVLTDGIKIPDDIFKAIYIPSTKSTSVFVAPNDSSETYKILTLSQFEQQYKINPFPSLN